MYVIWLWTIEEVRPYCFYVILADSQQLFLNDSQMILLDSWMILDQCLVILKWFSVIISDSQWFLWFMNDSHDFKVILTDSWVILEQFLSDSWWFPMILGESLVILIILGYSWWLLWFLSNSIHGHMNHANPYEFSQIFFIWQSNSSSFQICMICEVSWWFAWFVDALSYE